MNSPNSMNLISLKNPRFLSAAGRRGDRLNELTPIAYLEKSPHIRRIYFYILHKKLSNKQEHNLLVSEMAETLIGSEIIRLSGEINEKIKRGEKIYNLTIGDFDPKIFPIPQELNAEIINAYNEKQTNYPPANGIAELRETVSQFLNEREGLYYSPEEILISAGARPLIYATYQTLVHPGEKVIFPVPSWNNNHYTHLAHAKPVYIRTHPENNFMPIADDIKPFIKDAAMISLCSPLNPAGTVFKRDDLKEICDLVVEENRRRGNKKPLYVLFDQVYWVLTFGNTEHFDPVSLNPEMRNYTVFIDGISKSLAATGVRVGWAFGPHRVVDKMKSILSHLGAWAPKPEQVAVSRYLSHKEQVNHFLDSYKHEVQIRLDGFFNGFTSLRQEGFRVNSIAPQATIYLTIQLDLHGMKKSGGEILHTTKDITRYILEEAKVAIVPFYAFGDSEDSTWYRISVGTCRVEDVDKVIESLREALSKLSSQ